MGKRFGRTKKAKMRAEIQRLKDDLDFKVEQRDRIMCRLQYERDLFGNVVSAIEEVSPFSVCLPLKTVKGNPKSPYFFIEDRCEVIPVKVAPYDGLDSKTMAVSVGRLHKLMVSLREDVGVRERFKLMAHIAVEGIGEVVAYASPEVFIKMGLPAKEIARRLTVELSNHWRKHKCA